MTGRVWCMSYGTSLSRTSLGRERSETIASQVPPVHSVCHPDPARPVHIHARFEIMFMIVTITYGNRDPSSEDPTFRRAAFGPALRLPVAVPLPRVYITRSVILKHF